MGDIIKLLPDAVANQIAAGEVIQRPASVVKELMENAIDAGATHITLHIKNAGKTLIRVIDNGSGMSETDARMCWERHATSKLSNADDLFNIQTKGFRGEALASIAAIAHVELLTRSEDFELGTRLIIEGSKVISQEPVAASPGSSFSVKNLFYNVPARRNFLKSDPVETRHIIEEFQRVAIAHPKIRFSFYNNEKEVFILQPENLKQRLISILGKKYAERLLEAEAKTSIVNIGGFIAKPEFARKTRGEQYFFVNNRFIKSPYLNHAVNTAFSDLIPKDVYPSYFLFFEVDPHAIDVNIHPTKTEIKFEDERNIYAILMAAVKQALGKFAAVPSIDFNKPEGFDIDVATSKDRIHPPELKIDTSYNPFEKPEGPRTMPQRKQDWETFYDIEDVMKEIGGETARTEAEKEGITVPSDWKDKPQTEVQLAYQFKNAYIITTLRSSLVIIDQYRAHFRLLYEQLLEQLSGSGVNSQKLLFPQPFYPTVITYNALDEMKEWLERLGFGIDWKKKHELLIHGVPAGFKIKDPLKTLQFLADQWADDTIDPAAHPKSRLALNMASQLAVKKGKKLKKEEIEALIEGLFSCENPYFSPRGNPVMFKMTLEEIQRKFE